MIYDFVKADKMMDRLKVDPIQFHLLYLLYHRKDNTSTTAQLERFKAVVLANEHADGLRKRIDDLEDKGLIDNLNAGNGPREDVAYSADRLVVTPYFEAALIAVDCGEELWQAYPATMPLSQGDKFISRFGDKDGIINTYERKIRKDLSKHKFVMEQLEKFVTMVNEGRINGMKIQNFVDSEMWDVLAEVDVKESLIGNHGQSI